MNRQNEYTASSIVLQANKGKTSQSEVGVCINKVLPSQEPLNPRYWINWCLLQAKISLFFFDTDSLICSWASTRVLYLDTTILELYVSTFT